MLICFKIILKGEEKGLTQFLSLILFYVYMLHFFKRDENCGPQAHLFQTLYFIILEAMHENNINLIKLLFNERVHFKCNSERPTTIELFSSEAMRAALSSTFHYTYLMNF